MIRAQVENGFVHLSKVEGTGTHIMAELCCLVNSVCTAYCKDEEHSEEMTEQMILLIADALRENTHIKATKVCGNDENFSF